MGVQLSNAASLVKIPDPNFAILTAGSQSESCVQTVVLSVCFVPVLAQFAEATVSASGYLEKVKSRYKHRGSAESVSDVACCDIPDLDGAVSASSGKQSACSVHSQHDNRGSVWLERADQSVLEGGVVQRGLEGKDFH
jgi:hypothetical protein